MIRRTVPTDDCTDRLGHLTICRRERLGGMLREYAHAALPARMDLSAGTISNARPLRALPEPITDPDNLVQFDV